MNPEERLKAIRERLEATTPGDWIHLGEDDPDSPFWGEIRAIESFTLIAVMPALDDRTEDFNFIGHSKEDVSWLLAEIERLQVNAKAALAALSQPRTHQADIDYAKRCLKANPPKLTPEKVQERIDDNFFDEEFD